VPDLPAYQTVRFLEGSYPVYTGPGENYHFVEGAAVTGGDCRLYGRVGTWLLIGYGTSDGGYRIGYITDTALSEGITAEELVLGAQPWTLAKAGKLTDDPVMAGTPIGTIKPGTVITLLAAMPDDPRYLHVEVADFENGRPARGFMLRSDLE